MAATNGQVQSEALEQYLSYLLKANGQATDLVVAAAQDHIVPAPSAKALMDITGSQDKEYVELPGGHISVFAGRQASRVLFPKIGSWLAAHSAEHQG